MRTTDLADATARALNLLPPGDPAGSDPRMLRDLALSEESRLTREAAADVWLAVSPLRVAPADVLPAVLARVSMDSPRASRIEFSRFGRWSITASGWAAAALVTFLLWPVREEKAAAPSPVAAAAESTQVSGGATRVAASVAASSPRDERMQKEIIRLQSRLASIRRTDALEMPRVISLTAPGAPRRTPEEARRRLTTILTDALQTALELESDPQQATLVIERGWLPGSVPLGEDGVIHHRNFPEASWPEFGLKRSPEGEYLDPASQLVWSPDPKGRGFIGRKMAPDADVSRFEKDPIIEPPPSVGPQTAPEGFVIEDPVEKTAEIVIENVPPPNDANKHVLVISSVGGTNEFSLGPVLGPYSPGNFQPTGIMSGTIVLSLQNLANITSLKLIEVPIDPNAGETPQIIVESDP